MEKHYLRNFVHFESPIISDAELEEFATIVDFDQFGRDYEYAGNYIITKDIQERDYSMENMCCGIFHKNVLLNNGETIYFAFDYGH